jgi:hypothetical protein
MKHIKAFESQTPKKSSNVEETSSFLEEKWKELKAIAAENMLEFIRKTLQDRENLEISAFIGYFENYGGVSYMYVTVDKVEYPIVFFSGDIVGHTLKLDNIRNMLCVLDPTQINFRNIKSLEICPKEAIIWQGNDIPWELTKKIRLHRGTDISKKTGIA